MTLILSSPLALSAPSVAPGGTLSAQVTYQNPSGSTASILQIAIVSLPPGGTASAGPFEGFAPTLGALALGPGQSQPLSASRAFSAQDPRGTWTCYSTYQDASGWHDGPTLSFQVEAPPTPSCATDADCAGGLACVSGQCGACTVDSQCAATETCTQGQCVSPCNASLQSLLDAVPAGGTLVLPSCVFREAVTVNQAATLLARPGAEIRGSDIWTRWTAVGSLWAAGPLPSFSDNQGQCLDAGTDCQHQEQVYFDGTLLRFVTGTPTSGQFAVDGQGNALIAQDPTNHLLEVATRQSWLQINAVDDVTVSGFTMRHAANPSQSGALSVSQASHVTITNCHLFSAHGANLSFYQGSQDSVLDNELAAGGQEGYHFYETTSSLISGNDIHDNNQAGFDPAWEAGGGKSATTTGLSFVGNHSHDNAGPGLWCDLQCQNTTYAQNQVYQNTGIGIFYEISDGATINGNTVWENGWGSTDFFYGSAIVSSSSSGAQIFDNVVAWNADGINVVSQYQRTPSGVTGNDVHDNTIALAAQPIDCSQILAEAFVQDPQYGGQMFSATAGNLGSNNAFWLQVPTPLTSELQWNGQLASVAAFAATPADPGGQTLSQSALDALLADAGVPLAPQARPGPCPYGNHG